MSTTTTTPEPTSGPETADPVVDNDEVTTDAQDTTEDDQGGDEPGDREASKLRKRARAAEAERDTVTGHLDAMRRAEVERIAGATVQNPSALWATDTEVADLLTEDGTVDPEKVTAAAIAAAEMLGLARPRPANHVPREGTNPSMRERPGWSDALRQ